jgi:hypothetical protein
MQAFTNEGYACHIYNETNVGTNTFYFMKGNEVLLLVYCSFMKLFEDDGQSRS